ncbi:MAG TPA: putative motility protein [Firmicutes bacterium]|nr:putative motility protein [Bacillota bacterium]
MDVTALNLLMQQMAFYDQVDMRVLDMAIETETMQQGALIEMLIENSRAIEQAVNPHIGSKIDLFI